MPTTGSGVSDAHSDSSESSGIARGRAGATATTTTARPESSAFSAAPLTATSTPQPTTPARPTLTTTAPSLPHDSPTASTASTESTMVPTPPTFKALSPERVRRIFRSLDHHNRGYIDHDSIVGFLNSSARVEEKARLSRKEAAAAGRETAAKATTDSGASLTPSKGKKPIKLRELYAKELLAEVGADRRDDGADAPCLTEADGADIRLSTDAAAAATADAAASAQHGSRIDYEQFEQYVLRKEREIWELFAKMDRGKDGELCRDDIKTFLRKSGVDVSDKELQSFINHIDVDRDGVISFDEWLDFLLLLPRKTTIVNVYHYYQHMFHVGDFSEAALISEEGVHSTTKYLIAGGIAGAVSRSITAPLDRLKVLLQVHIEKQSVRTVFQNIMNDGGIWSFWRGNGLNIVKIIPESGIRFYVFETVKRLLHNNRQRKATAYGGEGTATAPGEKKALHLSPHNVSSSTRFIAGGVAGLASQLAIYPMETVKVRMMTEQLSAQRAMVAGPGAHKRPSIAAMSAWEVARRMYRTDGYKAFFRGLVPSLLGIVPYASIDLTAYESFKSAYVKSTGREPTPSVHMVCGATSALISASIVYPLGLIRTRLQAQGSSTHAVQYPRGAIDVITRTYQRESLRGFYKGLVPTLVKVVPAVSMSYIIYEQVKKQLGVR